MTVRRFLHNFFGLETRKNRTDIPYLGVERRQTSIKHQLEMTKREFADLARKIKQHG